MPRYNTVDDAPDQKPDWQLLRRLFGYIRPYRWYVDAAIACNLVVAGLQALRPWLTKGRRGNNVALFGADIPTYQASPATLATS